MSQSPVAVPPPSASQQAHDIGELVAAARHAVAEGAFVDTRPIEGQIASLCEAVRAAPVSEVAGLRVALATLIESLDELEAALRRQNDGLRHAGGKPAAPRATAAYDRRRKGDETS